MSLTTQLQINSSEHDRFAGTWLVREYIYDVTGTYRGSIRQIRQLEILDEQHIKVIQTCEPDAQLQGHPMADFTGRWEFVLAKSGAHRNYTGPDVLGAGFMWREGIMTGQGLWPRFAKNFTSYAFMTSPQRQCTGGRFTHVADPIASITGIAVPQSHGEWPSLPQNHHPIEFSQQWQGTVWSYDADGSLIKEDEIQRTYDDMHCFSEQRAHTSTSTQLSFHQHAHQVVGHVNDQAFQGLYQHYGTRWEIEGYTDHLIRAMEILDVHTQTLCRFQKIYTHYSLTCVEISILHPLNL